MKHEVSRVEADAVRGAVRAVVKLGADVECVNSVWDEVRDVERVVFLRHKYVLLGVDEDLPSIRSRTNSPATLIVDLQHHQHE